MGSQEAWANARRSLSELRRPRNLAPAGRAGAFALTTGFATNADLVAALVAAAFLLVFAAWTASLARIRTSRALVINLQLPPGRKDRDASKAEYFLAHRYLSTLPITRSLDAEPQSWGPSVATVNQEVANYLSRDLSSEPKGLFYEGPAEIVFVLPRVSALSDNVTLWAPPATGKDDFVAAWQWRRNDAYQDPRSRRFGRPRPPPYVVDRPPQPGADDAAVTLYFDFAKGSRLEDVQRSCEELQIPPPYHVHTTRRRDFLPTPVPRAEQLAIVQVVREALDGVPRDCSRVIVYQSGPVWLSYVIGAVIDADPSGIADKLFFATFVPRPERDSSGDGGAGGSSKYVLISGDFDPRAST